MESSTPEILSNIRARLASSQDRCDEAANIELAEELSKSEDTNAISALAELLATGPRPIQSDAIKALYEIGERKPQLLVPFSELFFEQMHSKANRIVWGCLTALACICKADPEVIFSNLDNVLLAADKGSVIAKDQVMEILITLKSDPKYADAVTPVILERLKTAALNQLPMYAERVFPGLQQSDIDPFCQTLQSRLDEQMMQSKRRRLEKILKKLST